MRNPYRGWGPEPWQVVIAFGILLSTIGIILALSGYQDRYGGY